MFQLPTLVVAVLALTATIALAQNDCKSTYGSYLQCIKGKLDGDYCGAEKEFGGDYKSLLLNCFTTDASQSQSKCFVKEAILNKAFDADGPLAGCNICITAARLVKGLFLTAKDSVMACIRKTISKAVGQEIETCIKTKKADFVLPPLPDFDEKSGPCRDAMLNSTGYYVVADWKLKFCAIQSSGGGRARRSAATASASQQCIAGRKVNGKEIWQKECSTMRDCREPFKPKCIADFQNVETISCGCIETKRVEVQKKIDDAGEKFNDIVKKAAGTIDPNEAKCNACDGKDGCSGLVKWKTCQCVQTATNLLDSNSNTPGHPSLRQLLKEVIGCAQDSEASQAADVDGLLKTLCFRVAQDGPTGADASGQLKIAINFLKSLFDALVLRVQRYCPGAHCPGTGSV